MFWPAGRRILLATGLHTFKTGYALIKSMGLPIQYAFHISDFVDYEHPELAEQVPTARGVYVPQALRTPLDKKLDLFKRAMDVMRKDYSFTTLGTIATQEAGADG